MLIFCHVFFFAFLKQSRAFAIDFYALKSEHIDIECKTCTLYLYFYFNNSRWS